MELQAWQQKLRATWMELQTCWASDVRQELRMMAQVEQFSSFPHAASRALSLLLENIEMVVDRQLWCLRCNVSMWHGLKRCLRRWHRFLRSSWQRNTDVSTSLHKLIGIGEVKLLSAAAGRVPLAFRWVFIKVHEQNLLLACHDQVAPAVHGEHQASDQAATVLMLLRVERDPCCTSLSLFDVPTRATRVADQ